MTTLNLQVQKTKDSAVGTLNWTIEQLNSFKLKITTLKSGAMCIGTVDENNKLIDIIAIEEVDSSKSFRKYQGAFKYDKYGEQSYSTTPYYRIWYAHETAVVIDEDYDGEIYRYALFDKVLTQASEELVRKFIGECTSLLLRELIARDTSESEMLEMISVIVQ